MRRTRAKSVIAGTAILGAAAALVSALVVRRQAQQAEQDHPPTGQFVTVNGVKLHFTDSGGKGPTVVLFHGNGAMIADMEISGLVDRLAKHHRVVVFDRPGYGYSERPRSTVWTPSAQANLFRQASTKLGLERPVVFGHSWGTLVALALALEQPQSVSGLVLASGYYFPTARADVVLFAPPAIPVLGDLLRYTIAPFIGRGIAPKAIRRMFAPQSVTPSFDERYPLELALRPSQIRASTEESAMMIPAAAAMQSHYKHLQVPVTILAGAADEIVDVNKQSMRLHDEIPHSVFQILPGTGHMLHHFATDKVVQAIAAMAGKNMRPPLKAPRFLRRGRARELKHIYSST